VERTQVAPIAGRTERRDGGRAITAIRPVRPEDLAELGGFFAGLSVESRYLRFFAPVTPAHGLLDLLAGRPANIDAIVAVADGVIVGHAMAADLGSGRAADIGVVVADAWQRRGVGAALMRALIARAQARGVTSLAMDVLPGNRRVLAMILAHWPDAAVGHNPDSIDICIPLPPDQPRRSRLRPAAEWVRALVAVGG
jgi:ribosomal protein S18 acetylase RimI-like enzyme